MAGGTSTHEEDAITGINVTPLVDIMLVLLIIFMVTPHIALNTTVPLDLPKAAVGTSDVQQVLSIIMTADGRALVNQKPVVNDDAIVEPAREALLAHPDLRAVIRYRFADAEMLYKLRRAGIPAAYDQKGSLRNRGRQGNSSGQT